MTSQLSEVAVARQRKSRSAAACGVVAMLVLLSGCDDLDTLAGLHQSSVEVEAASAYSIPLTITKGGTYTGRWMSTDRNQPAISIQTSEPVVIENAVVTGPGNLIWASCHCADGIDLTVRNVAGTETDSGVLGANRGNFVTVVGARSLQVSHSTIAGVMAGVVVVDSKPELLKIDNNIANNVEDRQSDGQGGVLPARSTGHVIILTNVVAARGAEIAWNQFVNEPGRSSVEDMISIFNSQGASAGQPINVHDNYLQGAVSTPGRGYAGGGIITDGDGHGDAPGVTAFVEVHHNQVVSTQNYGIAIAAGHDVSVHDNRVVSAGVTSSGQWLGQPGFGSPVAYYLWNFYDSPQFHNNRITKNAGALARPDGHGLPMRADLDARSTSRRLENIVADNDFRASGADAPMPTPADEAAEYRTWQNKLNAARQTVGSSSARL